MVIIFHVFWWDFLPKKYVCLKSKVAHSCSSLATIALLHNGPFGSKSYLLSSELLLSSCLLKAKLFSGCTNFCLRYNLGLMPYLDLNLGEVAGAGRKELHKQSGFPTSLLLLAISCS